MSDFGLSRFLVILCKSDFWENWCMTDIGWKILSILSHFLSFFVYFDEKSKIHIQLGPISSKLMISVVFGRFLVTWNSVMEICIGPWLCDF